MHKHSHAPHHRPRDVFRELLREKHIEGDELSAVFDELLALREAQQLV